MASSEAFTVTVAIVVPLTFVAVTELTTGFGTLTVALLAVGGLWGSGRIASLSGSGSNGSLQARAYLWGEGWRLVEAQPWTGIGRQAFGGMVDGGFPHAHNAYLMRFVESGVFGGVLFMVLVILCVGAAWRRFLAPSPLEVRGYVLMGLSAGYIGFALYSLTDYLHSEPSLMMLFWLWGGLALAPERSHAQDGPSPL